MNMKRFSAFSLVEITLSLGIIAFGLLAILALVPVGMQSGSAAIDDTRTALIGRDAQTRGKAAISFTMFDSSDDVVLPTWFYDREGTFIGTSVTGHSVYRADVVIHGD